MKSESTGTREASQLRRDGREAGGFYPSRGLVALAVILAFAACSVRTCLRRAASWPMPTAASPRRFCCALCSMLPSIAPAWPTCLAERRNEPDCDGASPPNRSRLPPRARRQTELAAISGDGERGRGDRSGHRRRNDTAEAAGAMKMRTEPKARPDVTASP